MTESEPDFAILLAAGWRALADRLMAEMTAADLGLMRPQYGYVIRAIAAEDVSVNRLAELLGVTKQAASKLAEDMHAAGLIERVTDPVDRRRLTLRLTATGERVRALALATSATIERELAAEVGAGAVRGLRAALMALVAKEGGLEDVLAKRARPVA